MQTLILNGCSSSDEYAQSTLALLTTALSESGSPPQVIDLEALRIADCSGCFGCWTLPPDCSCEENLSQKRSDRPS